MAYYSIDYQKGGMEMSCSRDRDGDRDDDRDRDRECSFEDILDSLDNLNRRQLCRLLSCIQSLLGNC